MSGRYAARSFDGERHVHSHVLCMPHLTNRIVSTTERKSLTVQCGQSLGRTGVVLTLDACMCSTHSTTDASSPVEGESQTAQSCEKLWCQTKKPPQKNHMHIFYAKTK